MVKVILKPVTDGLKPVELPVGKTVLGRGPLLGCSDKKVSRNHAVLDVTAKGNVFLTPIHVNPCFYRTKLEDSLKTMKKDHVQQLYPGDIISLLPHTFEYEICLDPSSIRGENDDLTPVPITQLPNPSEELAKTGDEPMEVNTQAEKNENNKEFNENDDIDSVEDEQNDKSPDNNKSAPVKTNEVFKDENKDVDDKEEEEVEEKTPDLVDTKEEKTVPQTVKPKTLRHRRTLPSWLIKCSSIQGSGERTEKAPPRTVKTPARSRTSKGGTGDSKQGASRSARKNRQTRQKISLEDFVVSEDDQWNSEASDKQGASRGTKSDSDWESEASSSSDWDVKKRKRRGRGGDSSESDWGAANLRKRRFRRDDSESGSDWEMEKNRKKGVRKSKGRRAKKKSDSEESDGESVGRLRRTSTSRANNSKRTPCMYGKKCYRRQPQHIGKFSHPGDSDYESRDEDDDDDKNDKEEEAERKKECPYGVDCYRKNSQHRKEFTHTKKVRPKREAAKKAGKKKDADADNDDEDKEEDGRDVDQSFENDSDAYAPESEGSGTEDLVKDSKKVLMNRDRKKAV